MKVVVLGATGHIGNALVRAFLAQDYHVTATSRRKEPAANLVGLPIDYACGNIETPGQLEAWIVGHDVVIDAAAPYPFYLFGTASEAERRPVAYATERIDALLEAVRKHKARLAYVSSFTTLTQIRGENAPWQNQLAHALHPYFTVKERMEAQILAAARSGIPAVIINPTMCLGPWDMRGRNLCFLPRLLCGEMPAAVHHILNVIDVRDVALGLIAALNAERYGEPLLLSGHNISTDALFAWICEIAGAQPPRFYTPATPSLFASYWLEVSSVMVGQSAPIPSLAVMLTCAHKWVTPNSGQRDLGIMPRPLSATLRDAVQWYRRIGYC